MKKELLIFAALLLSACGGSNGGDSGSDNNSTDGADDAALESLEEIPKNDFLVGRWVSTCVKLNRFDYPKKYELTFYADGKATLLLKAYMNDECIGDSSSTIGTGGKYIVGEETLSSSGVNAHEVDFDIPFINTNKTLAATLDDQLYFGEAVYSMFDSIRRDEDLYYDVHFVKQ